MRSNSLPMQRLPNKAMEVQSPHPLARLHASSRVGLALCVALACVALASSRAQAAEHITLRNGFDLTCDHRGIAAGTLTAGSTSQIRLFLNSAETNYVDVAPEDILAAELLPDAPVAVPANATQTTATQTTSKALLSPTKLHQLLASAGEEHHLDVDLLASLVHAESDSRPHAVSRAGAQGLMQLMPLTAAQLGVKDSFAPEDNVHGGTAYLDSLLKRYHDNLALALAAYNAGPGAVDRYHGVPPYRETRTYVARIIHEFNRRYAARQAAASLAVAR